MEPAAAGQAGGSARCARLSERLSATLSKERQKYTGTESLLPQDTARRKDDVDAAEVSLEYSPRDFFTLELGYSRTNRDSNRDVRANSHDTAYAQVKFTL